MDAIKTRRLKKADFEVDFFFIVELYWRLGFWLETPGTIKRNSLLAASGRVHIIDDVCQRCGAGEHKRPLPVDSR